MVSRSTDRTGTLWHNKEEDSQAAAIVNRNICTDVKLETSSSEEEEPGVSSTVHVDILSKKKQMTVLGPKTVHELDSCC